MLNSQPLCFQMLLLYILFLCTVFLYICYSYSVILGNYLRPHNIQPPTFSYIFSIILCLFLGNFFLYLHSSQTLSLSVFSLLLNLSIEFLILLMFHFPNFYLVLFFIPAIWLWWILVPCWNFQACCLISLTIVSRIFLLLFDNYSV